VRQLVGRVRTAVQDALDLPSRTELRQVMTHLEAVTRRLDDIDQQSPARAQAPAPEPAASTEPAAKAPTLEDERKKLKKLRKELKRELKTVAGKRAGKKRKKTKTTINVGSPKSMKERAKKKSKKD
jgi:hypothetical protein